MLERLSSVLPYAPPQPLLLHTKLEAQIYFSCVQREDGRERVTALCLLFSILLLVVENPNLEVMRP